MLIIPSHSLEGLFSNSFLRLYDEVVGFSLQLTLLNQPEDGSDTHTGKTYIASKGASDSTPPFIALVTSQTQVDALKDAYGGNNFRVQTAENPLAAQLVALLYAMNDLTYSQLQKVTQDLGVSLPPLLVDVDDRVVHTKKNRTALSKVRARQASIKYHARQTHIILNQ